MKLFALYGALLALACGVLVFTGDPSRSSWLPECPFYKTTGWLCYGCGSTRALHALLHGHCADSLKYNILLVPTLVWLGTLFLSGTGACLTGHCWQEQGCLWCLRLCAISRACSGVGNREVMQNGVFRSGHGEQRIKEACMPENELALSTGEWDSAISGFP